MKKKINKQVSELIPGEARVLDVGCSKGDFLFEIYPKITYGLGIDINPKKIKSAQANSYNYKSIEFIVGNLSKIELNSHFDYSILKFVIHSIEYYEQIQLLKSVSKYSDNIIIVDFVPTNSLLSKCLINIDEVLAGHYSKFKKYLGKGMEQLIKNSGLDIDKKINGIYDFYNIWKINDS